MWHPFIDDEPNLYDEESFAVFYDQDMNEITSINENMNTLNLGVWLNSGYVYRPVITARKEGSNKIPGSSGGGGCNVSSYAVIAFALLILKKRS